MNEEDIKILGNYKEMNLDDFNYNERQVKQAIENLINRNKELEIITNGIKVLETNGVNDDTYYVIAKTDFLKGSYKNLLDEYIPKSKVKEKIEELDDYDSKFCQRVLKHNENTLTELIQNILKELLEE